MPLHGWWGIKRSKGVTTSRRTSVGGGVASSSEGSCMMSMMIVMMIMMIYSPLFVSPSAFTITVSCLLPLPAFTTQESRKIAVFLVG